MQFISEADINHQAFNVFLPERIWKIKNGQMTKNGVEENYESLTKI